MIYENKQTISEMNRLPPGEIESIVPVNVRETEIPQPELLTSGKLPILRMCILTWSYEFSIILEKNNYR